MPLPIAAVAGFTALSTVADISGVFGFILGFQDDENGEVTSRLEDLKTAVDGLGDLQALDLTQPFATALATAETAADNLVSYAANPNSPLGPEILTGTLDAINNLQTQAELVKDGAPLETLAYAYSALVYAGLLGLAVANTVEVENDTRITTIREKVSDIATFLYDADVRTSQGFNIAQSPNDLLAEIESRIQAEMVWEFSYFPQDVALQFRRVVMNVEAQDVDFGGGIGMLPPLDVDIIVDVRDDPTGIEGVNLRVNSNVNRKAGEATDEFIIRLGRWKDSQVEDLVNAQIDVLDLNFLGQNARALQKLVEDDALVLANAPIPDQGQNLTGTGLDDILSGADGDDNLVGGAGDDFLTGFDGVDTLDGGIGNDLLRGGAGSDVHLGSAGNDFIIAEFGTRQAAAEFDTVRYSGSREDYEISGGTRYATVTALDGSRDKLFGVDTLEFGSGVVVELNEGSALDGLTRDELTTGERVVLLYEAALDRNGNIDAPGLTFYVDVTERDSLSDEFLARDLMTSPEFVQNFGDPDTLSNDAFLERIYENVLDRPSDDAGRAFYLDLLTEGTISKALALADIATSSENMAESTTPLLGLYENDGGSWSILPI